MQSITVRPEKVNNLFGELSAVVRDSDVFGDLIYAEGCGSPLAQQTLQQAGARMAPKKVGFGLDLGDFLHQNRCNKDMDFSNKWGRL